jgi:CubicO group peptidase (beta-lactamase class C family)
VEYLDWGDHYPGVTMHQMLSMMAGLTPLIVFPDRCPPTPCECDPTTTLRECGRTVFESDSGATPPGTAFLYSRWQLAGAVAEVVSNRSWAELVRQKLVEPCGLPNTGYRNVMYYEYPPEFDGDPTNLPETENPSPGGGAYSTVNDYSKVLLMHLRDGLCGTERVLSPATVRAMQEDLVPGGVPLYSRPEAVNYGMGWWKFDTEPGLLIDSGAYGARSFIHPEEDWGAIFILEADSDDGHELLGRIVPEIRAAIEKADQS